MRKLLSAIAVLSVVGFGSAYAVDINADRIGVSNTSNNLIGTNPTLEAGTKAEIRSDRRELRSDHRELRRDRHDRNKAARAGDKAGVTAAKAEIRSDKAELRHDRRELRNDRHDRNTNTGISAGVTTR